MLSFKIKFKAFKKQISLNFGKKKFTSLFINEFTFYIFIYEDNLLTPCPTQFFHLIGIFVNSTKSETCILKPLILFI